MISSAPARNLALLSRTKTALLVIFVSSVAVFVGGRSLFLLQGSDFPHFYCAARMLADSHGAQLYDAKVQRQYQALYAERVGTLYTHPPFEVLLYLAVAWLPLRSAYVLWTLLNIAFLAVAAHHLAKEALGGWDWRVLLVVWLTFVPGLICMMQGQDSLLLLLLIILVFTKLRHGHVFAAGCWLALGLFKFQVTLPLLLVLFLAQRRTDKKELAKGVSLIALALVALSAAVSGWGVFALYPEFLLRYPKQLSADIFPQAMANLRGLTYLLFASHQSHWSTVALAILCGAALTKALSDWRILGLASNPPATKQIEFDLAFSSTVLFALLVSFHLNPHDLSLSLLPITVLFHRILEHRVRTRYLTSFRGLIITCSLAILFLPPLHVWTLKKGVYAVIVLPLLFIFSIGISTTRRGTSLLETDFATYHSNNPAAVPDVHQ